MASAPFNEEFAEEATGTSFSLSPSHHLVPNPLTLMHVAIGRPPSPVSPKPLAFSWPLSKDMRQQEGKTLALSVMAPHLGMEHGGLSKVF